MKNIFLLLLTFITLVACNQAKQATDTELTDLMEVPDNLDGTWKLVNYYNYSDNGVIDSVPMANGYRQIKIYSDGKVMWSRQVPLDSIEWYGYGAYEISEDELMETIEFGSASMLKIIDTMRVFTFELEKGKDWYRQINIDAEGNRIMSENYVRLYLP
jgi:hypothetical protein